MTESLKRNHPMQDAETILQKIGVRHAPIQALGEDDKISGLDGRFVCIIDPPGPYYILGFENGGEYDSPNREKIQVLFWQCLETASAIAKAIGWDVEKIEQLPANGPGSENFDPVSSAIFVMRSEARSGRIPQPQDSISTAA